MRRDLQATLITFRCRKGWILRNASHLAELSPAPPRATWNGWFKTRRLIVETHWYSTPKFLLYESSKTMEINSVNVDKMPLKRHILLDFSFSRKKPPWLNKFVPVFCLGKCASAKASCAMLVPRVFSLSSEKKDKDSIQVRGEYRREKV